jgi:YD repeat-containing protein
MKRIHKIAAIIVALLGTSLHGFAQQSGTATFGYDDNGNRISHTFSSNQGRKNQAETNSTSTSTVLDFFNAMRVSLYPNPTKDRLVLSIKDKPDELSLVFKVTTISGTVLYEKMMTGDTESYDMSVLPSGIYMFQLIGGDRKHIWKVIKE